LLLQAYRVSVTFHTLFNFRPQDENHPTVKADGFANNLAQAVDQILATKS